MTVPDFQTLMLPVLRSVSGGEIQAPQLRDRIATTLQLAEQDLSEMLPSGRQTTFANRVAWANVFLQRAGLIEVVRRGTYTITEAGRKVLAGAPERIDMKYLEQFPSYLNWRTIKAENEAIAPASATALVTVAETPEELMEKTHASLTAALKTELLGRIREMSPAFFESLVVDLLVAMGYGGGRAEAAQAIGRSGDGGVDGIIKGDALGLDVVFIQAKRYADNNAVGRQDVQSFAGSLEGYRAGKGIFVTTSTFTQNAREYVERIAKRIVLIDGQELAHLLVKYNIGVRTKISYDLKKIDEDYFID